MKTCSERKDFLELLPPTNFFFLVFGAIIAGKVVLMVDKLPFVNRFPDGPPICNTLWKSLLYFLGAFVIPYPDQLVHFLRKHEGLTEENRHRWAEVA